MARPQKQTVDYFPHDADASDGRTLTILFNNFGHEGISAWWQLIERVSRTNNHVITIRNPEDMEFLAAKLHFKPERLKEILDKLASLDAIDPQLYQAGIIWCQNLIDRLDPVYKSRKQKSPQRPSLGDIESTITRIHNMKPKIDNLTDNPVSLTDNPIPLKEIPVSIPDNTQSKVEYSKLKESKVEDGSSGNPLLNEIRKLPGWKVLDDDHKWLLEFTVEFPAFSIANIRKCRDHHMAKSPHKKHIWKTALRNWMEIEKGGQNAGFTANRGNYQGRQLPTDADYAAAAEREKHGG